MILQMGVKEVLYRTKHLGWGTGTYVYRTIEELASVFPPRLRSFSPRVIEGPASPEAQPGLRIMHGPDAPQFQALRIKMETEWVPQLMQALDIERASLPIIWDADFLYGPPTASGEDTYVLCEINVSSCFPIPEQAPAAIARLAFDRCVSAIKPPG
jgi:hypothetical protein